MEEEEILVNNNNHNNVIMHSSSGGEYHHDEYPPSSSNGYRNDRKSQFNRSKLHENLFKERYKNIKPHIVLVNCSAALTSEEEKRAWNYTFNSLAERLSGRYDIHNITFHITDEPFGIVPLALANYKKNNFAPETKRYNLDYSKSMQTPDRMRERNERIISTIAQIRDDDPDNVFPLIIGFNSEKNIVAIENFRELSHIYKIKMIEKKKKDIFMYTPDFNQINFRNHLKRHQREEDHKYEPVEEEEKINAKRQQMPYHHIESQELTPRTVPDEHEKQTEYGPEESNQFTDRDIIDFESETPNDFINQLKIDRRIPEPLVSYEYYPNGRLWKITTMLVFPDKDYPDYTGEEE